MDKYGQLSSSSYFAITATSIVLFLVYLLPFFLDMDTVATKLTLGILVVIATALSLCGLYNYPLSTTVDIDTLCINYMIHTRRIPMSDIESVSIYDGAKRFTPIIGSYGFFGWWGLYKNPALGTFKITASNLEELVVIKLKNGKKLIFSCNDSKEMTNQIIRRLDF